MFSGRSWVILSHGSRDHGQEQPHGSPEERSPRVTVALRPPRRNDRHPSIAPWLLGGLLVLVAALTVLAVVPFALANDALSAIKKVELVASVVPALAFAVVGAVIVSRRPSNAIGWLCCAVGLGQVLGTFGGQGATAILAADPGRIPGGLVLYQLGSLVWELSWISLSLVLLLFPNGRPPSRRWRPAVWAAIAAVAGSALSAPFLPGPVAPGLPANPLGIEPLEGALRLAYGANGVLLVTVVLAAVVSLVVRFRRAAGVERQQLKWFAYGVGLLLLLAATGPVIDTAGPVAGALVFPVVVSGVPVAIGVAVLRYRLYDIDRIINRTLVYGLLTILLGAGYAGVALVLGQVFGGISAKPPSWAVAGATLAAAALFQPARHRIQAAVDRRFNRRKYDTARTIQTFSARLRDQLDLDTRRPSYWLSLTRPWSRPRSRFGSDPPRTAPRAPPAATHGQLRGPIDHVIRTLACPNQAAQISDTSATEH